MTVVLRGRVLREGDHVLLVSPASTPDPDWVTTSIDILESWGLIAEVGKHALDRWGYMAGRDEDRLSDLNAGFRDPNVRAIITTRGGAGAYRIADGIDFNAVRADPKPLVGFSDITYLHLALWQHCHVTAVHGALAGVTAAATVRQLLMGSQPITVECDPSALTAAAVVPGQATGPLVGGHLAAVAGSVEAWRGALDGAILFLESPRAIGLGQVDRALTNLRRSGALNHVRAVALGLFAGFEDYTDRGWKLMDVLTDRLMNLNIPVLGGLFAGHGGVGPDGRADQCALPLGATASLDAEAGTLTVAPCLH